MSQSAIKDLHRKRARWVEKHKEAERRYRKNRLSADDEEMMLCVSIIRGIDEDIADLIREQAA